VTVRQGPIPAPWLTASAPTHTIVLGAELNSGTLVVGTWYKITATEAAHFYASCAVGDTFRAAATTGLDANNKVKAISGQWALVGDPGTRNIIVDSSPTITTDKTQKGLVFALDSFANLEAGTGTYLLAYADRVTGKAYIDKVIAGAPTNLTSANITYGAAKRFHAIPCGASVAIYYDNTLIGTVQTVATGQGYGTLVAVLSTEDTAGIAASIWRLTTLATVYSGTVGCQVPMGQSGIYQCSPTVSAGAGGMYICYGDANNTLYAYHDGTNVALKSIIAGVTANVVAPTAAAYGAARVIKVEIQGQAAFLFYNGVYIGTGTVTALGVALTGVGVSEYSTDAGADWGTATVSQEVPA
jgi:hypothetical protein